MILSQLHSLLIFASLVLYQTPDAQRVYDSLYYEIAVNHASQNPNLGLHLADSLRIYAENDSQKMRAIMLTATIYDKQEKRELAIESAKDALKIAETINDYGFQARIYGFFGTQYRRIGLYDKAKQSIFKGIEVSKKNPDKLQVEKFQSMAFHELGDIAMEYDKYEEAIDYINRAILGYEKEENPELKNFSLANAEELLGRCYLALDNPDMALVQFQKANRIISETEASQSIWASMIYQGFGFTYLHKKEMDSAKVYLDKAYAISEKSNHGSLKELIYESMYEYYLSTNQLDSAAYFSKKYNALSKTNKRRNKKLMNFAYAQENLASQPEKHSPLLGWIMLGVGSLILGGIIYLGFKIRKNNSVKEPQLLKTPVPEINNGISEKTVQELQEKLKEFEASDLFLDRDFSLSSLTSYLGTNAKYMSYFLKDYIKKDFNTYINDLRIHYILNQLKTDPQYLNYKISYLAKISGFSSHSNFTINFKRVTDLSPSEFIDDSRR